MIVNKLLLLVALATSVSASSLLDANGKLQTQSIPSSVTTDALVAVISSPGTPSLTLPKSDDILSWNSSQDPPCLTCRGPTLALQPSDAECTSVALCSLTAGTIVLDGITEGDVEAGLRNSRHAMTLTALFRARVALEEASNKQSLILYLSGELSDKTKKNIEADVKALYAAAAAEKKDSSAFDKSYSLLLLSSSSENASQLLAVASNAAKSADRESKALAAALQDASNKIQESGITSIALDPPQLASAFVTVGNAHSKQARSARARIASWRSRVTRGLVVDGFGREAEALRKRTLSTFDAETLSAAGLPTVAMYRSEMRSQLQSLVESAIRELFVAQVSNLEKTTMKRLRAKLLRNVNNNNIKEAEDAIDNNAVALRAATFAFETGMVGLEVPSLGLSKAKATRDMTAKLNNELIAFPDSAAAKLKRANQVKKVVSKERKPTERAIEFGLDLVAMLRPDGFGSFQGYCGYQLGGNSLTFGVHNDADDPQVIAQFGGVRPPLLRVQPKLRVDVEL